MTVFPMQEHNRFLSAKPMTFLLLFASLFTSDRSTAQPKNPSPANTTIVLVHGLWADGSCWNRVTELLLEKGYQVITVQNPTTTIEDDVAATQRAIEKASGDVILVGHSWGGFVISEAGTHPKVKALVYVAAYVPDTGETVPSVSTKAASTILHNYLESMSGYVTLTKEGIQKSFANDLPAKEQSILYATQQPASTKIFEAKAANTAWKQKPSWYIVAAEDNTIHPELEKLMAARAKSKTTILQSCHVAMLAKPKEVSAIILEAAGQAGR